MRVGWVGRCCTGKWRRGEPVEIFGFDVAFVGEGGGGDGLVVCWRLLAGCGEGAVGAFAEVDSKGVEECCEVEL